MIVANLKEKISLTRWSHCCSRRVLEMRDQGTCVFFDIFAAVKAFFFARPKVSGLKSRHVIIVIIWSCDGDDISAR